MYFIIFNNVIFVNANFINKDYCTNSVNYSILIIIYRFKYYIPTTTKYYQANIQDFFIPAKHIYNNYNGKYLIRIFMYTYYMIIIIFPLFINDKN